MSSVAKSLRLSSSFRVLVIVFILAIATLPIIPNYFTGSWSWDHPPQVTTLQPLRDIQKNGLMVAGWQTLDPQIGEISGHKWGFQGMIPDTEIAPITPQNPVVLMLRPQNSPEDQPEVEWMDITGAQGWTADDLRRLQFSVPSLTSGGSDPAAEVAVNARFFRGWTRERTYAVVQWYAWPTGGHAAPSHWFWADQRAQWGDRRRLPWVAVSLLIPMKPLGDIEVVRPLAESLGKAVQSALMTTALTE